MPNRSYEDRRHRRSNQHEEQMHSTPQGNEPWREWPRERGDESPYEEQSMYGGSREMGSREMGNREMSSRDAGGWNRGRSDAGFGDRYNSDQQFAGRARAPERFDEDLDQGRVEFGGYGRGGYGQGGFSEGGSAQGGFRESYGQGGFGPGGRYGQGGFPGGYGQGNYGGYGQGSYGQGGYGQGGYNQFGQSSFGQGMKGRSPKGYVRSDERIREDLCDRLAYELDASEVEINVVDGEVTIVGTVSDRQTKFQIEAIADRVSGVKEIHNQLTIARQKDEWSGSQQQPQRGSNDDGGKRKPNATPAH